MLREDKIITNLEDYPELIFATFTYIKVYSKRLFPYLKFPPRTYQDVCPSARVMINSNKIYVAGDITVYYRQYPKSASKDVSCQNYLNLLIASKQVIDLRENNPEYYDLLSFLALKITYWAINHICNSPYFTIDSGECVYERLKEYPQYFTPDIIDKYQSNFPNYLQASPEALWDVDEMDYYDYLIKHRYQKDIKNLRQDIRLKNQEINNLNQKLKEKDKEIGNLKKENKKKDKKMKELINSKSWKITKPLRKMKRKIK